MRNPEKFEPKIESKDKTDPRDLDRERLKGFLNAIAAELKKEDVPYKDGGEMRINMYSHENISKREIERDEEEAKVLRKKFHEKLVEKYGEDRAKAREVAGENLEMLKTAIFYKYLRREFIIARSTDYDDIKRHVDNIILDKETGNIVCALDETTDLENVREKKEEVSRMNEEQGASLKYGLRYEEEIFKSPGKREIKNTPKVRKIPDIPLFYLSIPYELVEGGMSDFETDLEKASDTEYRLYKSFVDLMRDQIDHFPYSRSNQNTRTNLSNFSRESFPKFEQAEKTFSNS